MDWRNNEDAGDLSMMGAADFSGHLGEMEADRIAEHEGEECGFCGEPMTDPVVVCEGGFGEDWVCEGDCERQCA